MNVETARKQNSSFEPDSYVGHDYLYFGGVNSPEKNRFGS